MLAPQTTKVQEAKAAILSRLAVSPDSVAIALGSGLGNFAARAENPTIFKTSDIPHFPTPSVAGHGGELVFGTIRSKPVVLLKGRVHLYEGRSVDEVTFYVRLLRELGINALVLTNAAGGANPSFNAGDLCLISDIVNLTFARIPDLPDSQVAHAPLFDEGLRAMARNAALRNGIPLREGVYAGVLGPSYETRAEVRMLRTLRADLVGMSTVLEAIVAKRLGMRVLGVSLVTNKAAGLSDDILSHDDVQRVAKRAETDFSALIEAILGEL
ncbi:MAG: purine-nucleoside phosphorylase [Chloroherpetonaceae bacterium]|nr:purine-nucleoside phosphorylase [Chloroherpetonaceae bacterium]MDW8436837.1 purine-nucleoside phosphorylase [Chloroherpetonaceae bacterium]